VYCKSLSQGIGAIGEEWKNTPLQLQTFYSFNPSSDFVSIFGYFHSSLAQTNIEEQIIFSFYSHCPKKWQFITIFAFNMPWSSEGKPLECQVDLRRSYLLKKP